MKFTKFVKSLGTDGVIYEATDGSRWLATATVFMRIPDGIESVTGCAVREMPAPINKLVVQIGHSVQADLHRAILPNADDGIKDCVRVYLAYSGDMELPIANDAWSLIEKHDVCEIQFTYDLETNKYTPKALLVKQYPKTPADDDIELVGIIFPVNIEI